MVKKDGHFAKITVAMLSDIQVLNTCYSLDEESNKYFLF